ncbi:MAG: sensor histidine kinase [Saprospiraceae bacterium]|nr:sensor histidine kinase [Saprospiraceae bacterium]
MKQQAIKIEYHENLLANTVKTQENERNRISGELHDDVASKLNVVHLNVHLLKKRIDNDPEVNKIIDQIETSLEESINRTRVISHELIPQVLKKFGFHFALNDLCQSVNVTGNVHFELEDEHLCIINDDFKLLHLFRIIQELLSNTLKYANASNIVLSFSQTNDEEIIMYYRDDGVGFDAEQASAGLGLFNIKTRSELLKGEAQFVQKKEMPGCHFILKLKKYV